ncbi:lasso RiPP family leader peptide-containing protein [Streptomyces iconiensis]|uniref:Lasso RiPP family leader peptide-containing protein n=1 Tax=Streptomyces iconiensis TaxID=1384038 RepID=A0ABT6ZSN3_9ACTN|nr:lasso RiPP family leader peptide-containing protein [Streptomyces iconiensis]MDJ1132059.1 lasso RiPP family leader peptide-containing protein [Streptomyces iconiensis]
MSHVQQDIEIYEAPMVTEAGDFNEVTLGDLAGFTFDGGHAPFIYRFQGPGN